ncbi:hypothetical protein HMPREF7215_0741, partial [Pyramidobacter piscolens W5455]
MTAAVACSARKRFRFKKRGRSRNCSFVNALSFCREPRAEIPRFP